MDDKVRAYAFMFNVYFAKSAKNGKIYVGSTNKDPNVRIKEHNKGSNKWSSVNGPFNLIYFESYKCKQDAIYREKFYKTGVGKRVKTAIVKEFEKY